MPAQPPPDAVFADTWFLAATIHPSDPWASRAAAIASEIRGRPLVTTEEVLVEFLGYCSGRGTALRQSAVQFVRDLAQLDQATIHPQSHQSFVAGLELYGQRLDKGYSLVDCISMVTMRRLGITDVLTGDRHFAQEGFVTLF